MKVLPLLRHTDQPGDVDVDRRLTSPSVEASTRTPTRPTWRSRPRGHRSRAQRTSLRVPMRSQPTLKSDTADNHIHGSRSSRGNKHFFSAVARDSGRSPCVRRAHGGEPLRTNGRARSRVRRIVSYSPAGQTTAGCRLIGYAEARMKESPPGPSNPGHFRIRRQSPHHAAPRDHRLSRSVSVGLVAVALLPTGAVS